jgi:hypothetical protein
MPRRVPRGVTVSTSGFEQLSGRVQVIRDDSLDELACAGELHRRNLVSANAIFKLVSNANEEEFASCG